jgi:hypothetical protein
LTAITAGLATFGPPSHGEHQRVLRRLPERAVAEQRRIVLQADPRRIVSTEQFAVKAQPQRAQKGNADQHGDQQHARQHQGVAEDCFFGRQTTA